MGNERAAALRRWGEDASLDASRSRSRTVTQLRVALLYALGGCLLVIDLEQKKPEAPKGRMLATVRMVLRM